MFEKLLFWHKKKETPEPPKEVELSRMKYKDAIKKYGSDHDLLIALFEKYPSRRLIHDQEIAYIGPLVVIIYGYLREEYFKRNPK